MSFYYINYIFILSLLFLPNYAQDYLSYGYGYDNYDGSYLVPIGVPTYDDVYPVAYMNDYDSLNPLAPGEVDYYYSPSVVAQQTRPIIQELFPQPVDNTKLDLHGLKASQVFLGEGESSGESVWGSERLNPCIRTYTGGLTAGLKGRNKFAWPGWRTRLNYRGQWGTTTPSPIDDYTVQEDNNPEQQRVRCRRKPNWRRFRPFIPKGYYGYDYYY